MQYTRIPLKKETSCSLWSTEPLIDALAPRIECWNAWQKPIGRQLQAGLAPPTGREEKKKDLYECIFQKVHDEPALNYRYARECVRL
jgi:hypothetical protein